MNTLSTMKIRPILILLVMFQLSLKANAAIQRRDTIAAKSDTTKKTNTSVKVTENTTLYIRTGSTIVTKGGDTTLVINTDNRGDQIPGQGTGAAGIGAGSPVKTGNTANADGTPATTDKAANTDGAPATAAGDSQTKAGTTPVPVPTAGTGATVANDSGLAAKTDTTKTKKDSSLAVKTDTTKAKKDSSLVAKTDSLSTDTLTNIAKMTRIAFLEVGGPGLAISANYDSRFGKKNNGLGYRVGVGGFISGGNKVVSVPLQLNYLYGDGDHMLELGAGTTFLHSTGDNKGHYWQFDNITGFIATGTIGYRYQPAEGHLNLRIAFVPILYDEGLMPIGGISVGYTF